MNEIVLMNIVGVLFGAIFFIALLLLFWGINYLCQAIRSFLKNTEGEIDNVDEYINSKGNL